MKRIISGLFLVFAMVASAGAIFGQETARRVVQNPDGTYTIIEYPVGKAVTVTLDPVALNGATGTATILRDPDGTTIKVNLQGMPNDLTSMTLYAVEPDGHLTSLGPMVLAGGVGVFTTTAHLSRFMLVASPEANLVEYTPKTHIFFRSRAPEGYAIVPYRHGPVGEEVAAQAGETVYDVPMLNIPAYKVGDETKLKVNFTGVMSGARANIFIEPRKKSDETSIKFRFHDLKEAPHGKVYTVWAVSPDHHFERLGQILNYRGRNEAEIQANTRFPDFGLLVTMEDPGDRNSPVGPRLGFVEIVR